MDEARPFVDDQSAGLGLDQTQEVRDAEVAQLGGATRVEEHVSRLDVAGDANPLARSLSGDPEFHRPELLARIGHQVIV